MTIITLLILYVLMAITVSIEYTMSIERKANMKGPTPLLLIIFFGVVWPIFFMVMIVRFLRDNHNEIFQILSKMFDCIPQHDIQKCKKGHRYIAKSHEYPCPYCTIEKILIKKE